MEKIQNNLQQKEYFIKKEEINKILIKEQNKKRLIKTVKWLLFLLIIAVTFFGLYKLAVRPKSPTPGEFIEAQSRDHIQSGTTHPEYNSNPPAGGWHYSQPIQSGVYDREFLDEQLIHNLEHGHVWIAYKPDLPKDQIDILAKIALNYGSKVVMESRAANDSPIAIVAWERVLKLSVVDEQQVKSFINAYRGKGPETIPDFGFKDFRSQK